MTVLDQHGLPVGLQMHANMLLDWLSQEAIVKAMVKGSGLGPAGRHGFVRQVAEVGVMLTFTKDRLGQPVEGIPGSETPEFWTAFAESVHWWLGVVLEDRLVRRLIASHMAREMGEPRAQVMKELLAVKERVAPAMQASAAGLVIP